MTSANVKQAVPFFGVNNREASLRFYVDGLGFKMKRWWIPDRADGQDDYKPDGRIRWCWLELGEAAIMLQEFLPERQPKETLGTGVKSVFSAKTRWRSNRAESRHGNVHRWETACGLCR
jgi:lactoylglutathione lyase